jgi:tetratricopeptide (TPR) repeat protein
MSTDRELQKIRDLLDRGDYEQAELEAEKHLPQGLPATDQEARACDLYVEAMWRNGNAGHGSCMKRAKESVKFRRAELAKSPSSAPLKESLATAVTNQGIVHFERGGASDGKKAMPLFQRALDLRLQNVAWNFTYLAMTQATPNAMNSLNRADRIFRGSKGSPPQDKAGLALCLNVKALLLHAKKPNEARKAYMEALKYRQDRKSFPGPRPHPEEGGILNNWGVLEFEEKKYKDAEKLLKKALRARNKLRHNHPRRGHTVHNLDLIKKKPPTPMQPSRKGRMRAPLGLHP